MTIDIMDERTSIEKWVYKNTHTPFKGYRKDVITFIANIRFNCNENNKNGSIDITNLFGSGYCFYFAKILQTAFGGDIYWHQNHGHIVWSDDGQKFYDIDGPFELFDEPWEMVPVGFLGNMIDDFKHIGYYHILRTHQKLTEWKNKNYPNESDAGIVSTIFMSMPPYTEYHPGDTVEEEVYKFWKKNPEKCKEIIDEAITNS